MFEVLIREAAARFGLGDKALPLIQMLLAYMTNKDAGGLAGFLEKFKTAGCGPIIQSWLGGGPAAQPISNSQVENALGAGDDGLLSLATARLGLPRDNITSALGYLLPAIVGKLTPGGSIPASLPPEMTDLASAGQGLLSALGQADAGGKGGLGKWPWIVIVVVVVLGLIYFAKNHTASTSGPAPAISAPAPAAPPLPSGSVPKASFGGGHRSS